MIAVDSGYRPFQMYKIFNPTRCQQKALRTSVPRLLRPYMEKVGDARQSPEEKKVVSEATAFC